ncbi:MAG: oligosaccharide flippase family protein [Gemmatimonadaceae bacterium]
MARNSALYFSSLALPALAAVFLVPVTVRELGPSRFGLLALAWAVAEGAGMFDFGLGRATVHFVADATARSSARLREIVAASVFSQLAMGIIAATLLFFLAPLLVNNVFAIAPDVIPEASAMFGVLALHLPVLFSAAALRATLEGAQRFDLSTALRIPGSMASVVIPAAAASAGASLATIMWLLLAVRLMLVLISAAAVSRALLEGRWALPSGFGVLREILAYSGWVAVSAALGPALGSIDRFAVGALVGVTGLGFYTGASEAANRFLLIPATAFAALLPALALTHARGARDRSLEATRAARRQLAALLLPLCLGLFAFAPGILRVWLGADFASAAGPALRILAVGVFFGGVAHLPMALLYGSGRPDLPAKIHLVEVWIHVPLTIALVKEWGITGAALAWTLRCGADWVLYEWVSRRSIGPYPSDGAERALMIWLSWSALGLTAALAAAIWLDNRSSPGALAVTMLALVVYAGVAWSRVLSNAERLAWRAMVFRKGARS